MTRRQKQQKGAILPLFAVLLPALIGGLGLAVDTGSMYNTNRQMQTAADAAAVAAAQEMRSLNFSGYEAAAIQDAALNGYTTGGDVEVIVNRPPSMGPRSSNNGFVEVLIRQPAPTHFMGMFVNEPATITARAVAGVEPADACVYVLNETAEDSFEAAGSAHVELEDCGIQVNSSHTSGAYADGNSVVEAVSINVVGGYEGTGFYPTPFTGVVPLADPMAGFVQPAYGACDFNQRLNITAPDTVLDPGVYCGGLLINAQAKVTFNPGLYVMMGGGLTAHGGAQLEGEEVTFVLTEKTGKNYGPLWLNAGVSARLTPPTQGYWKGILFYQDPTISTAGQTASTLSGNASMQLVGVLYFPTTQLEMAGTFSSQGQELLVISDTLNFDGNAVFRRLGDQYTPNALTFARVVE